MFGHGSRINPGGIGHVNAAGRTSLDVHIVKAGAGLNQLKMLGALQKRPVNSHVFGNNNLGVADFGIQFVRRHKGKLPVRGKNRPNLATRSLREFTNDDDFHDCSQPDRK